MKTQNASANRGAFRRAALCSSALVLAATLPVEAAAQDADQTESSEPAAQQAAEIVVTARRRDESLSNVPIAITALGADDLVARAVTTDADLQRTVPGLTIRQTQGNNSLTYSLRGQSADIFSGSPSAVVTYLNEVPMPVSGASSFFDLESVQVLKGPQGTLFGRNATGGAVLFTSAQPTDRLEGFARAKYGNYDRTEVEGALNVPMADGRVLVRGAFNLTYADGYIDNLYTGETLGNINRENARLSVTLKPSETISNTTMVQYSNSQGTNTGASYTWSVYQCGETNNGFALSCGAGLLFGPSLDSQLGAGAWANYLATHPNAYAPGLLDYVNEQRRLGPYKTNHPGGADHFGEQWIVTNITEADLGSGLTLRNVFGLVDSYTDSNQPQLGAPYATILTANAAIGEAGNVDDLRSWTEEVQLLGETGALEWIVGFYMQRQRVNTLYPQTYFDLGLPAFGLPAYAANNFRTKNDVNAVYAQGTYDFTDALSLTAGIRYTWEKVHGVQLSRSDNFGPPEQSRLYQDPSWEVGLQYQATPELLVYAKTRGSFRSGGYNGTLDPAAPYLTPGANFFEPETTEDIEAGVKYSGYLFGRPATFNLAGYIQWIHDVQRVEFPDPDGPAGPLASIAITTNVPEERVQGIEAEVSFMPTDWLRLGGQLALTDAEFTDNQVTLFGVNYAYGPVGDTPEASGTGWAEVFVPTGGSGEITLRGEVYAQSSQYFSNAANSLAPRTELPGYALVNGRLSWNQIGGSNFSAAVFGENLLDEEYFVGGMQLAVALGHNGAVVGKPRMYGLELSYRF
ncbi:TonB-dependent receptor [Stakelama tenebrarum]|uniref:TonB-dependent receptor n=1 Tax=Stakelama tenebrarum TaxID=2711215 RepID=A0A6G6Y752_9SPHN|nr:TonB-dependent receptor [Sphingosinithalassobacter tenebrarum]QIG80774.1 TonB-dependent receptor [Sphingosinithalassobacter tenebrarum]